MDAGKQCLGKKPGKEGKKVIRRTSRKLILEEKKDRNRKKKTSIYYMLEMNEKRRGKVASKRKGIQQNQINVFWKAWIQYGERDKRLSLSFVGGSGQEEAKKLEALQPSDLTLRIQQLENSLHSTLHSQEWILL
jgi:hypothetical protein